MTISVLGAGSWGFALAIAMSHVAPMTLWSRDAEQVAQINATRTNTDYLPADISLPSGVVVTNDFLVALKAELIIIATPSAALRTIISQIKLQCNAKFPDIIWVCKGFEATSGLLPHQVVYALCPDAVNIGALLGPSFAEEVACGLPTAITLACNNLNFATKWIKRFITIPNLRIYANLDIIGAEVGAAVKNVIAIAAGVADGLALGYNARAALITRSLSEIRQLVNQLGGKADTIYGLTGIGDLILTCTGDLSRNRLVGLELARGKKIDTILANLGHVAEGVNTTREIYNLSQKLHLTMPIVETVYKIIYEQADIRQSVSALLNREPKLEF